MGVVSRSVILVPCATEDPSCEHERCAHSVLSNQLWYLSSSTGQLMSSFTGESKAIPPLVGSSSSNLLASTGAKRNGLSFTLIYQSRLNRKAGVSSLRLGSK